MALGGGTFVLQNKTLPGAYINFVSAKNNNVMFGERGYATMPLLLDWGEENKVFEVTNGDFQKYSTKIFGYDYTHEKMKGLRDLFRNAKTAYLYRLNGGGVKASNTYATAKYGGTRGNDLKTVIVADPDNENKFIVKTLLDTLVVDEQGNAATTADLVDNDYVTWKASVTLAATAGLALANGTNGTVTGTNHQTYLDKIESYTFNTMGVDTTESTVKALYAAFVKRMRDEMGVKFQLVLHSYAADYLGTINVKNSVSDTDWNASALVYWVTGASAGCEINKSNLNKVYDGEFTVGTDYTQHQLEAAIKAGEFTFHMVGDDVRVLEDINSYVNVTDEMGDVFQYNQVVRVCDQIGNDIATIFNTRFLGVCPNDEDGRLSFWGTVVKHHKELQKIRAIQGFDENDITVERGDEKDAVYVVDAVEVTVAMGKLYMIVKVA